MSVVAMEISGFRFVLCSIALGFGVRTTTAASPSPGLVDKVVMSMGVQGDSSCVIGPQLPHGSINPSPQTPHGGHDGYAPGEPIRGFGQLQVSGTGWGTYGQFLVSPQIGLAIGETDHDSAATDEIATPAYYAVTLARYGIRTEVTPTRHAAIYRITYPAAGKAALVFDLAHNIPADIAPEIHGRFLGGELWIDTQHRAFSGFGDYAGGFNSGAPYRVYFYAVVDTSIQSHGIWSADKIAPDVEQVAGTGRMGAYFQFPLPTGSAAGVAPASENRRKAGAPVHLKIAVSFRNVEHARRYLEREIPAFDFEAVRAAAAAQWNQALGAIAIEGASPEQESLFYTALYHSQLMPRDRTGDNAAWDSDLPYWDDQYAVWDTWRTKFPLMCLIRPDVVRDNVMSFYDRLEHRGEVGDSFVFGDDGPKQGGDDVDAIIAEAYATDVKGIDWSKAFAVLKHDAEKQRYPEYLRRGWISEDKHPLMTCSNTLECAYNDACAALVAEGLARSGEARGLPTFPQHPAANAATRSTNDDGAETGDGDSAHYEKEMRSAPADAARWRERSRQWEQLWNPDLVSDGFTGFVQPRMSDGAWMPLDPKQNFGSWHSYFYEANSWTYSLFVPHDFGRLITLSGGNERFTQRVDHAFAAHLVELANEPSFMAARAFNYAGRPDRNAYWTHKVMSERYSLKRGYPGNEDSGAMGSWYVFSALGFFPNAGQGVYLVNGPFCRRITLTMGNNRQILIEATNVSATNIYVESMKLNGQPWLKNWFTYADIRNGAHLEFIMGPEPSSWGAQPPFAPSLGEPSPSAGVAR